MLEVTSVQLLTPTVPITGVIKITFALLGGKPKPFTFPFSNESLTENLLEFIEEEG